VALPGHFKYFKDAAAEEQGHAELLMEYLNKRGGRVVLHNIEAPEKQEWGSAHEAMSAALELEKSVNEVCSSILRTSSSVMYFSRYIKFTGRLNSL